MKKIDNVKPFVSCCHKAIPLAFDESMSYYEVLCALTGYIKEVLVPAINGNIEETEKLQELFIELQDYVDNYFKNLDIQNEINNKLDDMAESGQLIEIISQYLNTNAILGFNTIADMQDATNVINGSLLKCYGQNEYNDNKGAFYKVRQLTSSDVIDEFNIVSLVNYPTLICERIYNQDIIDLQNAKITISYDEDTIVFVKGGE